MPISYTYNTLFIHIPKCAGTTVEKILGTSTPAEYFSTIQDFKNGKMKTPQHLTYLELKSSLDINWSDYFVFSVVRNPYSRFVSEYNYRRNMFLTMGFKEHDPINFETFVQSLDMEVSKRIPHFDGHLETQTSFLKNERGFIEQSIQIFKFEDLSSCWKKLEEKAGVVYEDSFWSRKSIDSTPYQSFYTPDIKSIIYEFYKEDFVNFGYSSEL